MRPELIIAEKEFRDHLTSKRFIVITVILLLVALYGISVGMDAYNKKLDDYKQRQSGPHTDHFNEEIKMYQKMIDDARDRGEPEEMVRQMQAQLDLYRNPPMPSVLEVFQNMIFVFTLVGMVLGAAMGFDQIAREKDEGSLKFLASSPVYRDAIINGKTIGAIGTLAAAMAAVFAFTIAIVMLRGVVPGTDDLARITLFFVAALLYCTLFYAVAMMLSTLSRNTALAAVSTVGVIIALAAFSILSIVASDMIANAVLGPAPEYTSVVVNTTIVNTTDDNRSLIMSQTQPGSDYVQYGLRKQALTTQIAGVFNIVSPISDFGGTLAVDVPSVGSAILARQSYNYYSYGNMPYTWDPVNREQSLLGSLLGAWMQLLALVVETLIAFAVAYVVFMRADIR